MTGRTPSPDRTGPRRFPVRLRSLRGRAGRSAFTLVELLVAIAVIGLLAALLFPVLGMARGSARSAVCKSNLRQLGLGMALYIDDNDGHCMPVSNDGGDKSFWFGLRTASFGEEGYRDFDRTKGYLYPYLKTEKTVEQCPNFDARTRAIDGRLVGYAYNRLLAPIAAGLKLINGKLVPIAYRKGLDETVMYHELHNPSRFVVFADGGRVSRGTAAYYTPAGTVEENYYLDLPDAANGDCGVHFRHNGKANVLFADWHVEEFAPRSLASSGDKLVGHFAAMTDWPTFYCPDGKPLPNP